ncbi:serine/threonine protein phosphatase PrpC [Pseudonocardia hierapolitana]|uniref:Serine/threonine protein phosphatase PrpC n=1 Tax=Pseudonocardia hierapolitana TaxID=1128676 RepID=A0A561SZI1_9PSEU|nr:serine/threonine protein phosphatase PrpC [Pseudonocardia hierapolitana]
MTTDHTWSAAHTVEAPPVENPVQYVTRWIGRGSGHRPAVETRELTGAATIVLTTDELHDFYPDAADLGAVVRATTSPGQAADHLIDRVLTQGSGNKTAVVIELGSRRLTRPVDDAGGPVVIGEPLTDDQRREVAAVLRAQASRLTPLDELPHRMPRGPPGVRVLVAGDDVALPHADRLVGFGWAEAGAAVITRVMLDEIAGHIAAGRLDEGFWSRLLGHEQEFHLHGAEHTGPRHDAHAAELAGLVLLARVRREAADPAGSRTTDLGQDALRHLRAVAALLADHPVLHVLGTNPIPVTGEHPTAAYGEYFGNPDFRASEEDRRRYLANPPITAGQNASAHRTVDKLGTRIPRADLHAVVVYLSALYAEPNAALRSGDAEQIARYEDFIRVAASGFNQLDAVDNTTTYRAIWLSQSDIVRLRHTHPVGGLVIDPGFVSTELPDPVPAGADPVAGLRTIYYLVHPVTIEVRSRTGRNSWPVMQAMAGGRFHELTFIPGSTFVVRDLQVTRHASGEYGAHMVWEDVSHLRPSGGPPLHRFHAELVGDLAVLREQIARGERTAGLPPAEARDALELTQRLLAAHFTEQYAPAPPLIENCANCGYLLGPADRFCEACGTERTNGAAGSAGQGGAVADGVDGGRAREVLMPSTPALVAGARPLRGEEFPHLARGPPELTGLVRITDERPLGGKLIGFGWRPEGAAPGDGVIVVPAAVAALVDRLVGLDAGFAAWWERLLRHEWEFHLAGDEHTGDRHDQHAAALVDELRAAPGEIVGKGVAARALAATVKVTAAAGALALGALLTPAAGAVTTPSVPVAGFAPVRQLAVQLSGAGVPHLRPRDRVVGEKVGLTGAPRDTVSTAMAALRVVDRDSGRVRPVSFAELNAANGDRFDSRHESIAGKRVWTPENWTGVWVAQRNDHLWRIYVERFGDRQRFVRAYQRVPTPDRIFAGSRHTIEKATVLLEPERQERDLRDPTRNDPDRVAVPEPDQELPVMPAHERPSVRGSPWPVLLGIAGAVLGAAAVFFGIRAMRRHGPVIRAVLGGLFGGVRRGLGSAVGGVRDAVGAVFPGWGAPMVPGPVRARLWAGAVAGAAAGLGLVLSGAGPPVVLAGVLVAVVSVVGAVRAWWTPRQSRAPPRAVAAAGRAVRAWFEQTRIALEDTYGFRFPDPRSWAGPARDLAGWWFAAARAQVAALVGAAREQAGWWITAARFQVAAGRDRVRAVVGALRGWNVELTWEHRAYPTAVQYVIAWIPVVGPWLAGSLDLFQLLHLKFKVFTRTAKVWQGKIKGPATCPTCGAETGPSGWQTVVEWFGRARAFVAKLRYNRAFTSVFPWMTPAAGPEFHWGWFGVGLKVSYGNLGSFTVLDLAELGGTTNNRNRVLGLFPVVRVSLQIYLADSVRLDFFLLHFDVPGKKLEQKFATPQLTGWNRLNVPLRFWRWIRTHDLSPWTWKPWQFISQSQWGIGIGPRDPLLPNFYEHRGSAQTLEIRRHGKPVRKIHMVQDPGPVLGRALGRLAHRLGDRLGRRVPARVRTDARILWALVWRRDLAERRRAHEQRLRGRGLRQLDAVIAAQLTQLAGVLRDLRDVEDVIRTLSDRAGDPIPGAGLALTSADARRALLERLRDRLIETIAVNQARRAAIEEGPGSTREPITPPPPVTLTLLPARTERAGVVESGTLPGASAAPGAGRVGFDLGDVMAGRSDPGHPDNPNLDAMAGAVRSADGRIFAAVADQQGTHGPHNAQIAVTAAITAALAEAPATPAEQVVRMAFAAAAEAGAAGDSTTTLLLVVVTPTGPNTASAAFGWVGDSRGYLIRSDVTEQATSDHTWSVAEAVEMNPAPDPVQYVTRWLGRGRGHPADVETRELTEPSTIVLTTDELHDFYPDAADLGAVIRAATSPGQAADDLIEQVAHLGSGNKSTIVIRLDQPMPGTGTGTGGATGSAADRGGAYHADGGPVADGVDSAAARDELLPLMPAVVADAPPIRAEEFPHLARGPPGLVNMVRITDEDLLDGRLIGFGWRPEGAVPEEGVILVPARVASLVDRLIGQEPAFAVWWERFLRHEWDFHLAGAEHTGHRHDRNAAALAEQLRARYEQLRDADPARTALRRDLEEADRELTEQARTAPHQLLRWSSMRRRSRCRSSSRRTRSMRLGELDLAIGQVPP